jgi:hypothetical protein
MRNVLAVTFAACIAGCQTLPPERDAFSQGESLLARLNATPESCLQTLYLRCSSEAIRGRLGRGEIAACSVVYETLLKRSFGGDFDALLAWSRQQADDAAEHFSIREVCWQAEVKPDS